MATPAYSSNSPLHSPDRFRGAQLEWLSTAWNEPPFVREEPGTFALSFSPLLVRHLMHRYSQPGDTVLDCFLGSGVTVLEAELMQRFSIGVDCNEDMVEHVRRRLPERPSRLTPALYGADARSLSQILAAESVDLIITQPPYGSTHRFSEHNPQDLSLLNPSDFLSAIEDIAEELYHVLKPGGWCALLIGDCKDRGRLMPLGFQFARRFLARGFSVRETYDHRTPASVLPVPLHHHEYLFLFQKQQKAPKRPLYKC